MLHSIFTVQVRLQASSALFFETFATTYLTITVKFTLEQAIKTQRQNRGKASLTSALDGVGGQRHAPAALPLGKRPGTHCTGGWLCPMADLDECGKSRPHRDSIPRLSVP